MTLIFFRTILLSSKHLIYDSLFLWSVWHRKFCKGFRDRSIISFCLLVHLLFWYMRVSFVVCNLVLKRVDSNNTLLNIEIKSMSCLCVAKCVSYRLRANCLLYFPPKIPSNFINLCADFVDTTKKKHFPQITLTGLETSRVVGTMEISIRLGTE